MITDKTENNGGGKPKENQKYTVNNFCINKSKFGPQVCVDVDNTFRVSLPKRFLTDFNENTCKFINENPNKMTMVYKGAIKLNTGNNFYLIEFE